VSTSTNGLRGEIDHVMAFEVEAQWPEPYTLSFKPQTTSLKPEALNPKP